MSRTFTRITFNSAPIAPAVSLAWGSESMTISGPAATQAIADIEAGGGLTAVLDAAVTTREQEARDPTVLSERVALADAADLRKIAALAAEQAAIVRRQAADAATQAAGIALADTNAAITRATTALGVATAASPRQGSAPGPIVRG